MGHKFITKSAVLLTISQKNDLENDKITNNGSLSRITTK